MFGFIDVNTLVLGLAFGLALSTVIVWFLVHAAITAPQHEDDRSRTAHLGKWSPTSRYESRRTYLHAVGYDPDVEW